jgi:hypothetical protein
LAMFVDAPWPSWKRAYGQYESIPIGGCAFAGREAMAARKCDALLFGSCRAIDEAQQFGFLK